MPEPNARQTVYCILQDIQRYDTYSDVALNRWLKKVELNALDRGLVTELVYGITRKQRLLDALISQLARKPLEKQPRDLRIIFSIGLYQLRYLDNIPGGTVVYTSVELAKQNGLQALSGVVNGVLRQYMRSREKGDPLKLPDSVPQRLALSHSYPDWIVEQWLTQLPEAETEQLCEWFNRPPTIDLRVNTQQSSVEEVETALREQEIATERLPHSPQGLRLVEKVGALHKLPGFDLGWWTVQDGSAQLVSYLLDPQPGEVIIDACAAPGGKSTHIAELMGDSGTIIACDLHQSRVKKITHNIQRLQLKSIQTRVGDIRQIDDLTGKGDRVLVDAPCSGLGTLHRHADGRWRQTPELVEELSQLQQELLDAAATWVKPGGVLVYSTCTLHPHENERVVTQFLNTHSQWQISPTIPSFATPFLTPEGYLKVWPHQHQMDGFFMVALNNVS